MPSNIEYNQIDAFKRAWRLLKQIRDKTVLKNEVGEDDDEAYTLIDSFLEETAHLIRM